MNVSLSPGERISICTFTFLVMSVWAIDIKAQLARSTWAQGGSGYYSSQKSRGFNTNVLNIEARAGYFFVDRLVAGLGLTYQRYVTKTVGGKNISSLFSAGPFLRYYFLTEENSLNFLATTGFEFGINGSRDSNKLPFRKGWIGLGPTYFINESVAIELLAEYEHRLAEREFTTKTVLLSVGFQVFLQRNE